MSKSQRSQAKAVLFLASLLAIIGVFFWTLDSDESQPSDRSSSSSIPLQPDATEAKGPLLRSGKTLESTPFVESSDPKPATAPIDPLATLQGRVVDESGSPIASAIIKVRSDPERGRGPMPQTSVLAQLQTDAQGRFQWPGLMRREAYAIEVSHPDYTPAIRRQITRSDLKSMEAHIVLQKGPRAIGQVQDEAGQAIAGALVQIYDLDTSNGDLSPRLKEELLTDEQGRYRTSPLLRGEKRILARKAGFATAIRERWNFPATTDAEVPTLVLKPGAHLSGRVIDVDRREPIAGALVKARITGVALAAVADPSEEKSEGNRTAATAPQRAFVGTTPRINPTLMRSETTPDGRLRLTPAWPSEMSVRARWDLETLTDESGQFQFDGLIDATYALWVEGPSAHSEIEILAAPGCSPLDLPARAHATLEAQVLGPDGQALTRFVVAVTKTAVADLVAATERHEVNTDEGRFVRATRSGSLHVHVWAEGCVCSSMGPIEVPDGARIDLGAITLFAGAMVRGRILTPEGAPIEGAELALWPGAPTSNDTTTNSIDATLRRLQRKQDGLIARTDARGEYRIAAVPAGPFTLRARAVGRAENDRTGLFVPATGEVQAPDLALEPESGIALQIKPTGSPMVALLVSIDRPDLTREVAIDEAGALRIGELAAGRYRLLALPATAEHRDPGALVQALMTTPAFPLGAAEWLQSAPFTVLNSNLPITTSGDGPVKSQ